MITPNFMLPIAHVYIKDRGYTVYVSMSTVTNRLHVFKYSEETITCEYEVFNNHLEAEAYLEQILRK